MKVNAYKAQKSKQRGSSSARPRGARETMRPRSASEVLGILEPTSGEPASILAMGLWKTGTLPAPQAAS
jgi:hypothetical protein